MTGQTIPYHLRQNKAVDRIAFLDLLNQLSRVLDIKNYHYIGFGSHSLEDFKHIHTQFGMKRLTSLEIDMETFKRQKFNKPISCIKCLNISSTDYITLYNRKYATMIWLDFVSVEDLSDQLGDFKDIIAKMEPYDIVKITLNANPSNLKRSEGETPIVLQTLRLARLKEISGTFFSNNITLPMMTTNAYPKALLHILRVAADAALLSRPNLTLLPLANFSYKDGQEMFSYTGIVIKKTEINEFKRKIKLQSWPLHAQDWSKFIRIDIPDFTPREKLLVDSLLPSYKPETIQKRLKFNYKNKRMTIDMLGTYKIFYRHSPYFSRIML